MMEKSALWALQKAVFNCLSNDANLSGMITGVFDGVDEETTFPYVTIGDDTSNPNNTKTTTGEEMTTTIHVWSIEPGRREVKQIMDSVLRALTGTPLIMDEGFSCDGVERELNEVLDEGAGKHGVCRFRFYINHN